MENPVKLVIKVSWFMKLLQFIFALFFTYGLVLAVIANFQRGSVFAVLLSIIFFGGLAYLGYGNALSTIQVTEESVTVNVFYGRFRIRWDEVKLIVFKSPFIALMSDEKRLVLSIAFAGKKSKDLLDFINQQIQERNIMFEVIEGNEASFPLTHHNAREWH